MLLQQCPKQILQKDLKLLPLQDGFPGGVRTLLVSSKTDEELPLRGRSVFCAGSLRERIALQGLEKLVSRQFSTFLGAAVFPSLLSTVPPSVHGSVLQDCTPPVHHRHPGAWPQHGGKMPSLGLHRVVYCNPQNAASVAYFTLELDL